MKSKTTFGDYIISNLGKDYLNKIWSEKNDLTPFDYPPRTKKKVWLKCSNGLHEDKYRSLDNASRNNYYCSDCSNVEQHNKQRNDLIGKRFGRWTVKEFDKEKSDGTLYTYWICECDCGIVRSVSGWSLTKGVSQSCGCLKLENIFGENNWNWQGGVTSSKMKIRGSRHYRAWRKAAFERDNYTCQCCGERGGKLNVHHILDFANHEELRLDLNNAITLCEKCHAIDCSGSFHNIYGTQNNTPEQLEEYINNQRKQLGINVPFNIKTYKQGDIMSPILL